MRPTKGSLLLPPRIPLSFSAVPVPAQPPYPGAAGKTLPLKLTREIDRPPAGGKVSGTGAQDRACAAERGSRCSKTSNRGKANACGNAARSGCRRNANPGHRSRALQRRAHCRAGRHRQSMIGQQRRMLRASKRSVWKRSERRRTRTEAARRKLRVPRPPNWKPNAGRQRAWGSSKGGVAAAGGHQRLRDRTQRADRARQSSTRRNIACRSHKHREQPVIKRLAQGNPCQSSSRAEAAAESQS